MLKQGNPLEISTSTSIIIPSIPVNVAVLILTANDITTFFRILDKKIFIIQKILNKNLGFKIPKIILSIFRILPLVDIFSFIV